MPSQFIRRSAVFGLLCCFARAATFEIVPVRSTQPFEISGNTIVISPGAQRIFFDVTISDWAPETLQVFQVALDSALITPDPSLPALAVESCVPVSQCTKAFGSNSACVSLCQGGDRPHTTCFGQPVVCSPGQCIDQCEPAFVNTLRPDFVFAGQSAIAATSFGEPVSFGATPLSGPAASDSGTPRYVGTVVIDVPAGWLGAQIVGFADDPTGNGTFVATPDTENLPLTLVPARIVLRCDVDADCDDANLCTQNTCDTDLHRCPFTPTFDAARSCCDPETGDVTPIDDDENDCTIDRCTTGETSYTFSPVGASCGDQSSSTCDAPDTCNGAGFCTANRQFAGVACGPTPTDVCSRTPACDGLGHCVERFAPPFTPCGTSGGSANICGGDFCDGEGNCVFQFQPAGFRCRDAGPDPCDGFDDECDGAGNCVERGRPAGTRCGASVDHTCDHPDLCDGLGNCERNFAPVGTECVSLNRCGTGTCDGIGSCQATTFAPVGTLCGGTVRETCDSPDTCDGQGQCVINHVPAGTACDVNPCVRGVCTGTGYCQTSHPAPAGSVCGSAVNTTCNPRDTCDGHFNCQSNLAPEGTACTGANPCETGTCDGIGSCQVTSFAPVGTACGSGANTTCSLRDTCDGQGHCLTGVAPAGTPCALADPCQSAVCDGSGSCQGTGTSAPAGTACGSTVNTTCNQRDTCDGLGQCQSNFAPAGRTCGSPANTICDRPDTCDGSGNCLLNTTPADIPCGEPGDCEDARVCDGSGDCQPIPSALGTPCGTDIDTECNRPDFCDGNGHCATHIAPVGTPCGSQVGTTCDRPDTCDGLGSCRLNRAPDRTSCEDGVYCNGVNECLRGECHVGWLPCAAPRCHESTRTCDPSNLVYDPFPPDQSSLWRESRNEIRLRPQIGALPANRPAPGEMLIQELLPDGLYGPDLSPNFSFNLVDPGLFGGPELLIREQTPSLEHRKWYAVRAPNGWPTGGSPILFQFQVLVGDAVVNIGVSATDLIAINAYIPTRRVNASSIRMDITGDGKVNAADLSAANRHLPSLRGNKPNGH